MKLRNKKTGKIIDLEFWGIFTDGDAIGFESEYEDENEYCYNSIAELNEEWEDYTPQEPLIKDEKILKAVKAWAEANDINEIKYDKDKDCIYSPYGSDDTDTYVSISFDKYDVFKGLEHRKSYTIAELCGEEDNE